MREIGVNLTTLDLNPIIGGALIGVASAVLYAFQGRIAGISGIIGGSLKGDALSWRLPFLVGLIASALVGVSISGLWGVEDPFVNTAPRNLITLGVAGFIVGIGSRLGNGCTSGHGVCGIARGSKRSISAVLVFMTTGMITAVMSQHLMNALVAS